MSRGNGLHGTFTAGVRLFTPWATLAVVDEATGVVEAWDDPRGVGVVRADDGRALDLQCTHIADGSRTTAVGTRVAFVVAPGHHGRWQATAVAPL